MRLKAKDKAKTSEEFKNIKTKKPPKKATVWTQIF